MLLLAIDTSGKNGSLALVRVLSEQGEIVVLEGVPLAGGAFSAQLVPQIALLLERHGHEKRELDAFVVVNGPGSFTGLRVGLAAVKALAEALEKPIAAISLLEAIAWNGMGGGTPARGRILALLDAGRGDVYAGDYAVEENSSGLLHRNSERLLGREALLAEAGLPENREKVLITPDAALAEALRAAGCEVVQVEYPESAVIARLGWEHLRRGLTVGAEALEANYMRVSDAEIFSKPSSR